MSIFAQQFLKSRPQPPPYKPLQYLTNPYTISFASGYKIDSLTTGPSIANPGRSIHTDPHLLLLVQVDQLLVFFYQCSVLQAT